MPYHMELPSSSCHEDKLIIDATTSDAGKIITPSGTTNGKGELRKLNYYELNWGVTFTTSDNGKVFTPSASDNNRMVLEYPRYTKLSATGFCVMADAGKVITPSSTEDGKVELRTLKCNEIDRSNVVRLNMISVSNDTYAITAAVDTTFATPSDYIPYPFTLNTIHSDNVTYNATNKTFTIGENAGAAFEYLSNFSVNLTSNVNTTRAAIAYKVNGTLVPYRFVIIGKTAGDAMTGDRHRHLTLSPGDVVQLCIACDKSCTLTQQDVSFSWAII